jgi:GT2 family glycosyltransferase
MLTAISKENPVLISFIIITYHRGKALQACLDSISEQQDLPENCEVIIVDNGGDATFELPNDTTLHFHTEIMSANLGVAGGRNHGMAIARGEYLIFLDDDAVWHDPYDASRLVRHLKQNASVGAVAVQVRDIVNREVIEWLLPHPNKSYIRAVTEPIETPYYYGGGHILRASAVEKVGPYPERFVYGMEEIDLSLRLVDGGYKIIYDPQIAILHPFESSVRGSRYWKTNAINKSRVAWRLLPQPYPWTITIIWSALAIVKTRSVSILLAILDTLFKERKLLRQERKPIRVETVKYLKRIGARLLY